MNRVYYILIEPHASGYIDGEKKAKFLENNKIKKTRQKLTEPMMTRDSFFFGAFAS